MNKPPYLVSGPADILISGSVISYLNHPIQINIAGLDVVFKRTYEVGLPSGVTMGPQDDYLFLVEINRQDKYFATTEPEVFGEIQRLDAKTNGVYTCKMALNFTYTPIDRRQEGQFGITYTIYAIENSPSEQ